MKKLSKYLFLLMTSVIMAGMWSCSDDDPVTPPDDPNNPTPPTEEVGVNEPAEGDVNTTSAKFTVTTANAESFVYVAVEGENATAPDPVVAFANAEANGTVNQVTGPTADVTVYGLEGNTTYTVFFIFNMGAEYQTVSQVITTTDYSQVVTVIETTPYTVKLHVEVPETMYYVISMLTYENYIGMQSFGSMDVDFVTNLWNPISNSPRFKGPRTFELKNGDSMYAGALNEADWAGEEGGTPYAIHPGTAYVIFVSECGEDGDTSAFTTVDESAGGGDPGILLSQLPNIKEYSEENPTNGYVTFNGEYAKTVLFTEQAALGEGSVSINVNRVTERTAYLSFQPTQDVLQYTVVMLDESDYETYVNTIGGEEGLQAVTLNYGEIFDSAAEVAYPIQQGHSYTVMVTAVYKEDGSVQTFHRMDGIEPIVSELPAAELTVTPLQLDNPYQVGFNVKAPNGDCSYFVYLLNYTHEWWPMLNSLQGETLEANLYTMVNSFGQAVTNAEVLQAVNSAEGYDLIFSSMDETESWLVLESFNADEKVALFYGGSEGEGFKATSGKMPEEERVQSELFNTLKGNWIATMTRNGMDTPVEMPVVISDAPAMVESLPADVHDELMTYFTEVMGYTPEMAEATIEGRFQEYQERSQYFKDKYAGQNYLLATGFEYDTYMATLASSWDLFCSTTYSSYSTDELFRDFGPKLFFKISKDDEGNDRVTVVTTQIAESGLTYARYVDPVANWRQMLNLYAYDVTNDDSQTVYMADFPVEVSEDGNTLTIQPVVDPETNIVYTPCFTITENYFPNFITADGITLTRATASQAQAMRAATRSAAKVTPKVSAHQGNYFRRTSAPYGFQVKPLVEGKVFSLDSMKKDIQK